jgi:hypothetical protein
METTRTAARPARVRRRLAYAALGAVALAVALGQAATHGTGWWQLVAFGLAPDLALVAGAGSGLARGQLHPRAVRLYNAVHSLWAPLALVLLAVAFLPLGYLVGALAWAAHIALDRALGYGPRTPDGFQRR